MNYQRPQLIEELAAQYVLGTLRGPARRRFERYCKHNATALHAVRRWEDRLVDLLANVVPVAPSTLVWDRIKFRVRRDKALRPKRVFATFGNWRFAAAAGIAALAIAFGMWTGFGPGSSEPVARIRISSRVSCGASRRRAIATSCALRLPTISHWIRLVLTNCGRCPPMVEPPCRSA